ncbi:MAG TPA: UDP-glucose/GDP-mannose dehydrogenase family protein [Terriglobia bacterium]|nr:UDP-glucose/GDP-mannose dehydrogenase family protein [Terriglobia bacterium]
MQISVIGCGYVGLVTGACLAEAGHEVVCTDKDSARIAVLNDGGIPIYELHLDELVAQNRRESRLKFTADAAEAVRASEVVFICVGTPPLETGDADLSAIDSVARLIATAAKRPKLVVEKSTVPVRTGRQLKQALSVYGRKSGVTFRVASNPEFLREGTAVKDFLHPERIVVGVDDEASEKQLQEIYQPIIEGKFNCPVHNAACPTLTPPQFLVTDINSAELIKHACNSFLALKITYANALSDLCELLGANVEEVTRAMGLDARIGPQFLAAGLGFGGSCLPKDVQAFIRLAEQAGMDFALLKEVERLNRQRVQHFVEKVRKALWVIKDKKIGVLGLAFKPNTDDIRSSPPVSLVKQLLAEGAHVSAYDPAAMERTQELMPEICYSKDAYEAARGADALLIATEWQEFGALDWDRIYSSMARPLVVDGRNLLDPDQMAKRGFEYHSFGRPE